MRRSASSRSSQENTPSSSGEYVPASQTITWPPPYSPFGMTPSNEA